MIWSDIFGELSTAKLLKNVYLCKKVIIGQSTTNLYEVHESLDFLLMG